MVTRTKRLACWLSRCWANQSDRQAQAGSACGRRLEASGRSCAVRTLVRLRSSKPRSCYGRQVRSRVESVRLSLSTSSLRSVFRELDGLHSVDALAPCGQNVNADHTRQAWLGRSSLICPHMSGEVAAWSMGWSPRPLAPSAATAWWLRICFWTPAIVRRATDPSSPTWRRREPLNERQSAGVPRIREMALFHGWRHVHC
jgi:hypothetical protein